MATAFPLLPMTPFRASRSAGFGRRGVGTRAQDARGESAAVRRTGIEASGAEVPGTTTESPYAEIIATVVREAREEIGYHRENFIRVDPPEKTAFGSRMGRYREVFPSIEFLPGK
jgi:8-oxo-dGTP pyrophosphatase MutT (NUDIX family)